MRIYQILVGFSFIMSLAACSSKGSGQSQAVPQQESKPNNWGPIETTLSDSVPFENSFEIPINQALGKQDYFITQPSHSYILLMASNASVTGCDAKQIVLDQVWFEDATQTIGSRVSIGETIRALPGRRGLLQIGFRNLTGCTSLSYKIKLQKF